MDKASNMINMVKMINPNATKDSNPFVRSILANIENLNDPESISTMQEESMEIVGKVMQLANKYFGLENENDVQEKLECVKEEAIEATKDCKSFDEVVDKIQGMEFLTKFKDFFVEVTELMLEYTMTNLKVKSDHIFEIYDKNKNNKLEEDEFKNAWEDLIKLEVNLSGRAGEKYFNTVDKDKSKDLDKDEFLKFYKGTLV